MTAVTPILDKEAIEKVTELRARLTRGGLSPEAIQKAIEAFEAGEIHALNFTADHLSRLVVPIPEALLVKLFPNLMQDWISAPPGEPWTKFLATKPILEFEIKHHRGDRRSLTIRWPGTEENEGPESEASEKEKVAASAAEPDPF